MVKSIVDPCVLIHREKDKLKCLIFFQVDNSMGFGDTDFLDEEEAASSQFNSKPRTLLTTTPSTFNGISVRKFGPEPTAQTILVPGSSSPHPPVHLSHNQNNTNTVTFADENNEQNDDPQSEAADAIHDSSPPHLSPGTSIRKQCHPPPSQTQQHRHDERGKTQASWASEKQSTRRFST